MRQTLAIARYTALEALRTRAAISAGALLLLLFAASYFIREIAIADSHRLQTTFLAATSRLACVFIASLFIISAVVREFNDKGHLLLLSQDLSRAQYALGKFLGFAFPLAVLCVAAGMLEGLIAGFPHTIGWTVALVLEVTLMAAVSLFCALSLRQVLPAAMLSLGFYLLARGMADIQLIAHASLNGDSDVSQHLMARMADGLALLLPRLDTFASSQLLVDGASQNLPAVLAQTLLYGALALTAATIDLFRREL